MKQTLWPFLRLIFCISDTICLGPSDEGWRSLCTSNTRMQLRDHVMTPEHLPTTSKRQKRSLNKLSFLFCCKFDLYSGVLSAYLACFSLFEEPPTKLDAYTVFYSIPTHRISTIFTCYLLDDSLYLPMYPAVMHSHFSFLRSSFGLSTFLSPLPHCPTLPTFTLVLLTGVRFCI